MSAAAKSTKVTKDGKLQAVGNIQSQGDAVLRKAAMR